MSISVMSWVWSSTDTKGSTRLVLLALADSANDSGVCWPSIGTIAKKANLEKRYVMDILKSLETDGMIRVQRRKDGLLNKSNIYTIVMPASLPSDEEYTTPSDAEDTRVVMPASPKPLINRNTEPKRKRKITAEITPAEILTPVVDALALVTKMDARLNYGRIAKEAKMLIAAGYTAEQISGLYGEDGKWYSHDWRGKKGQPPTLVQVRETIGVLPSMNGNGNGNGKKPPAQDAHAKAMEFLDKLEKGEVKL